MDKVEWTVCAFVVLGIVAVVFLVVTRRKGGKQNTKIKIKGLGLSLDASSTNEVDAGMIVEDANSKTGRLVAEDQSGRGVRAKRIAAQNDIVLVNSAPPEEKAPKS
jgi:hypothetical protein